MSTAHRNAVCFSVRAENLSQNGKAATAVEKKIIRTMLDIESDRPKAYSATNR